MSRLRQHLTKRWLRIAAAIPVGIGAIVLTTTAPASAAPMSASFRLLPSPPPYVCEDMSAVIPTNEYDTWGYLYNGAHARVQLWGDDPIWDDLRFTSGWAYLNAPVDNVSITGTASGIVVRWRGCSYGSMYYEDIDGSNELYVRVTVIDGAGSTLASARSNVVQMGNIVY
jgi:hypothetical protein